MDGLRGDTGTPTIIATDRLVIATAQGNPAKIKNLKDLATPGLKVVLAAPEVPAGRASRQILDAQDIHVTPVSLEPGVHAALNKIELGEADAALVYKTDADTAPDAVKLSASLTARTLSPPIRQPPSEMPRTHQQLPLS